jgi:hypothetical protein
VDPEHIAKVKRIMGIKPEASPYAKKRRWHHTWVARSTEFNAKICATSEPK